jgi:acyl-CoA reductase-like NAD-dependent aldehyde dehydrogenase
MMLKVADLIERDLERAGRAESIDNGKPNSFAQAADLPLAVDMFRYMGGSATKISGRTIRGRCPASISPKRSRNRVASSVRSSRGTFRC